MRWPKLARGFGDLTTTVRLSLFEFLAFPAHCYLWLVPMHCGYELSCGPVEGADDEID